MKHGKHLSRTVAPFLIILGQWEIERDVLGLPCASNTLSINGVNTELLS